MNSGYPDADDLRILRDRLASLERAIDLRRKPRGGAKRMLVQVYNAGSIPTAPDHFFACHPGVVSNYEHEGDPATPIVDTTTTVFVNFLHGAPAEGDLAVATLLGGRWVAEKSGTPKLSCLWWCGPSVTIDQPTGRGTNCAQAVATVDINNDADGTLGNLVLIVPGACYTVNPTVTISPSPGGGTRATATAIVGQVSTIESTNAGKGYLVAPNVTIAAPGGAGTTATVTATIDPISGSITSLTLTDRGSLYTVVNPVVTIDPPPAGGVQATAIATAQPGIVTTLTLTNAGTGYTVDRTPPTAFQLTIASPNVSFGPILLIAGGSSPAISGTPLDIAPNGQQPCRWGARVPVDIPATASCPAIPGVLLTAGVSLTNRGWNLGIAFGVVTGPEDGPSWTCNDSTLFNVEQPCQQANPGAQNATALVGIGGCPARPFSQSTVQPVVPTLVSLDGNAAYQIFGGPTGGDCEFIPVTYTLTEVAP